MLIIPVKDGGIDKALKIFKVKVKKTKLVEKLKGLVYFEKPSVKKRLNKKKAIYIQSKKNLD
jgi:small subunit ribosomal protein S21